MKIVPVVEGVAEVEAVAVLLRRILVHVGANHVQVAKPFRVHRNRVVKEHELENAIAQAISSREGGACVLVLLDADDDCPATLGPELSGRCQSASSLPSSVVLAVKEFEAWFLGAKQSLRGVRGISEAASPPPNPESIRGAKEELSHNMEGRRYLATDDQPALAAEMDLEEALRNCPSFDKLVREVTGLINAMGSP